MGKGLPQDFTVPSLEPHVPTETLLPWMAAKLLLLGGILVIVPLADVPPEGTPLWK